MNEKAVLRSFSVVGIAQSIINAMAELERMRSEGLIKAWGFGINRAAAAVMAAALDKRPTSDIVLRSML
ncbi:hypothetical protein [Pectobacterium polaris]|uniref:hypothetical protein n=1 Tax=Pectobacterium polaris TaxID=2042057 RepID=UPI00202DA90E|nr:hypothetical protein [Pectobacterium polaris]MCL6326883.1 hypothetical protein [Pectobacterium polaris]